MQRGSIVRFALYLDLLQISGATTFASGAIDTVGLGYDLNEDSAGGNHPFLINPRVLGRSTNNARVNPLTGQQYSQANVPITVPVGAEQDSISLVESSRWAEKTRAATNSLPA
jgi:hypothetical protein